MAERSNVGTRREPAGVAHVLTPRCTGTDLRQHGPRAVLQRLISAPFERADGNPLSMMANGSPKDCSGVSFCSSVSKSGAK